MVTLYFWSFFFYFRGPYFILYLFQFPTGLPGIPGMPPAGPPRLDLPASLGGSLPPPRGSDPLMSLGPSAPSSGPSAPGLRPPSNNDKVNATDVKGLLTPSPNLLFFLLFLLLSGLRIVIYYIISIHCYAIRLCTSVTFTKKLSPKKRNCWEKVLCAAYIFLTEYKELEI